MYLHLCMESILAQQYWIQPIKHLFTSTSQNQYWNASYILMHTMMLHEIAAIQAGVLCLICSHAIRGCSMPRALCVHIRPASIATNMLYFQLANILKCIPYLCIPKRVDCRQESRSSLLRLVWNMYECKKYSDKYKEFFKRAVKQGSFVCIVMLLQYLKPNYNVQHKT